MLLSSRMELVSLETGEQGPWSLSEVHLCARVHLVGLPDIRALEIQFTLGERGEQSLTGTFLLLSRYHEAPARISG